MLKRFMSWLLNRLQKLLSPLSSGRHSHASAPSQSAVEADQSNQNAVYRKPSVDTVKREPASPIAASAQPVDESADVPDEAKASRKDTVRVYEPVTVNLETSSAASDLIASGALNYLLETPDNDELPEIHDLLPAVEPEASAVAGPEVATPTLSEPAAEAVEKPVVSDEIPVDEPSTNEDLLREVSPEPPDLSTDRFDEAPEVLPEEAVAESEVDPPPQAVLFSFDIIESEPTEETASEISASEEVRDTEETLPTAPLTIELTDETPGIEDSIAIQNVSSEGVFEDFNSELPGEETLSGESLSFNKVPVESSPEDRIDLTETRQIDIAVEPTSPEANIAVETAPVSATQPPEADASAENPDPIKLENPPEEPTKQGVVKLLFTLKQGNYHGYIAPDDGTKDILFHQKYINADIFDRLERGANVVAAVKYIEGKAYATRVDLL